MKTKLIYLITTSDWSYDQRLQRISESLQNAGYAIVPISRLKHKKQILSPNHRTISPLFERTLLFYLEYNIRLFYILLINQWDIVYSVDADSLLAASLAKWLKRKQLIFDAHEYFEESPEIVNKPFVKWVWESICKFGIPKANLCLTVSQSLADTLGKKYNVNFLTIRNLPLQKESGGVYAPFEKKIIWYQGVLNVGRGLEQMIAAMVRLTDFELHMAGEGDLSNDLRKLVDELGLSSRVKFLGWKHPDHLHQLASEACIGINLLDGFSGNYYHSLANKTFDYIQAGLPGIHMDFPEYRNLKKQYGAIQLIPELSEESIIAAIKQMIDPVYYTQLKQECFAAAKILIWEEEEKWLLEGLKKV
ncbi:MAG: glycosyltransferase [Saprospiraceae bacterium]|nr:glycosyltransferase [Saprospiraceae bacterium]